MRLEIFSYLKAKILAQNIFTNNQTHAHSTENGFIHIVSHSLKSPLKNHHVSIYLTKYILSFFFWFLYSLTRNHYLFLIFDTYFS